MTSCSSLSRSQQAPRPPLHPAPARNRQRHRDLRYFDDKIDFLDFPLCVYFGRLLVIIYHRASLTRVRDPGPARADGALRRPLRRPLPRPPFYPVFPARRQRPDGESVTVFRSDSGGVQFTYSTLTEGRRAGRKRLFGCTEASSRRPAALIVIRAPSVDAGADAMNAGGGPKIDENVNVITVLTIT